MATTARFRRAMFDWHREHARSFPWRETSDPYRVLVGELLLQRTRGENASAVYREFLRRWPTPERLSRAHRTTIERVIRPLGLAKRADLIARLGRLLGATGGVPTEPSGLLELPGVGPYAAHAVAVFAFDRSLPLVDWVISRVLRRYFGLPGTARPNADAALWALATRLARPGNARALWLGALDFAAAVCRPHPLCDQCPLAGTCLNPPLAQQPRDPAGTSRIRSSANCN